MWWSLGLVVDNNPRGVEKRALRNVAGVPQMSREGVEVDWSGTKR